MGNQTHVIADYAGTDKRRSRSAAENIIPNNTAAHTCVEKLLPKFAGKLTGHALNVPIHKGSMMDMSLVLNSGDLDDVNDALEASADTYPGIVSVAHDPIVSSDIIGSPYSVTFDLKGTMKAGSRMAKVLGWHETLGHAHRVLDVARIYHQLDQ